MSSGAPELQPDVEEVLQTEGGYGPEPVVKVCVEGLVRAQPLPRKTASTITKALGVGGTVPAVQILRADPRRASALLVANVDIRVAFTQAVAEVHSTMAWWPVVRPLRIEATTDVWIAADTAAGSVSAIVEYWATGQDGDG